MFVWRYKKNISQHIRKDYLSHKRSAMAQASMCLSAVSPEPFCSQTCSKDLEEAMSKKKKKKKKEKEMSVAQIGACAFGEPLTGKSKGPIFVCQLLIWSNAMGYFLMSWHTHIYINRSNLRTPNTTLFLTYKLILIFISRLCVTY